jgi:hypothetical protein
MCYVYMGFGFGWLVGLKFNPTHKHAQARADVSSRDSFNQPLILKREIQENCAYISVLRSGFRFRYVFSEILKGFFFRISDLYEFLLRTRASP